METHLTREFVCLYIMYRVCIDYVLSCGIPLMPVMYQVVGFGWRDGRPLGYTHAERSVISEG